MTAPAYFNSVERVIRVAMQHAGLLEELQDPTPEQFAENKNKLADLANYWQTQGLKLFLWNDLSITLTAGTGSYTLGPGGSVIANKPMRGIQGYYLDSSSNSRPIYAISWNEWITLSTRTSQGPITQFFIDKQVSNLVVNFWLVPDTEAATGTAHIVIESLVTQPISLTDTIGFPVEWFLALGWGLADQICTGQPEAIMTRCERNAEKFRAALEAWDVEDADVSFQPDTTQSTQRRFT